MNCQEFEQIWNERLDACQGPGRGGNGRAGAASEGSAAGLRSPWNEQGLAQAEAHAAGCASCRDLAVRFERLERAIVALGPAPAAPERFADRFFEGTHVLPLRRPARAARLRMVVRYAAAAAVFAAGFFAVRLGLEREGAGRAGNLGRSGPTASVKRPAPAMTIALADARAATWDLAVAASAPAARIGSEVLSAAELEMAGPVDSPPLGLPSTSASSADVFQQVGDRINAGVRPLSGSARHAFSFLLDPAIGAAGQNPPPARPGPHEGA